MPAPKASSENDFLRVEQFAAIPEVCVESSQGGKDSLSPTSSQKPSSGEINAGAEEQEQEQTRIQEQELKSKADNDEQK